MDDNRGVKHGKFAFEPISGLPRFAAMHAQRQPELFVRAARGKQLTVEMAF